MQITIRTWNNYIARLSRLNEVTGQKMREYIRLHGTDDTEALISYAYAVTTRYGEGSAALACQMYDALAEAEGVALCAAGVDEALQVAALVVEGGLGHGEGAALHDRPERVVRLREPGEHA